jgi:hypothetical protein
VVSADKVDRKERTLSDCNTSTRLGRCLLTILVVNKASSDQTVVVSNTLYVVWHAVYNNDKSNILRMLFGQSLLLASVQPAAKDITPSNVEWTVDRGLWPGGRAACSMKVNCLHLGGRQSFGSPAVNGDSSIHTQYYCAVRVFTSNTS